MKIQNKSKNLCFFAYVIILCIEFFYWQHFSFSKETFLANFYNYAISDWLINYESGFIRRGLCGQILYFLYEKYNVNVGYLVYLINYSSLIFFTFFFIQKWKQNKLSYFLLPSICLIGGFAISELLWFRRDILIFLIIWGVFKNYQLFLFGKKRALIYLYILSGIAILSHEASFFYCVPIIGLHYFLYNWNTLSIKQNLIKTFYFLLPTFIFMFPCLIYKGDTISALTIWHSWDEYFVSQFGYILPVGQGCEALGWNGVDTFKMHFNINYLKTTHGIFHFLIWPFIFGAIYYLLIQANRIKIGINKSKFSFFLFSHILIIQFIFLIPMFTILSCDFRRVILYWTLSSFLFYFSLEKKYINIFFSPLYSFKIQVFNKKITSGFLGNKTIYVIIYLLLGYPYWGMDLKTCFEASVLGNIYLFINLTTKFLCNVIY